MEITKHGWELLVTRIGFHRLGEKIRTYGRYQVYVDGTKAPGLAGFMCESRGPGDNSHAENGKRIEQGRYPLWTQFGSYKSIGYSTDTHVAGKTPMPAIALAATGHRNGILIHPAHPPTLFLSSIGCLNPTAALEPHQSMDYWDSRGRVIALLESLKAYAPQAFAHETMTRIGDAAIVIDGDSVGEILAVEHVAAPSAPPAPAIDLPISERAAEKCARWLMDNFAAKMQAAVRGKAYGVKHLCAIVCQESAYKWVPWIGVHPVATILGRAVYDASGDYPGAPRSAFPRDTAAFRARYGQDLTEMLIEEANRTRRMQNYGDKPWVYKGYGIFQYDLQQILTDEPFFRQKLWYDFHECLKRVVGELDRKLVDQDGDLWEAIRAYNGRGASARDYAAKVRRFTDICAPIAGD